LSEYFDVAEEARLRAKALKAENCLDWLEVCQAACCREFEVPARMVRLNEASITIVFPPFAKLSSDQRMYYRLHGGIITGRYAVFKLKDSTGKKLLQMNRRGPMMAIHRRCNNLNDQNLCDGWASGDRPEICKTFDEKGPVVNHDCYAPKNCLACWRRGSADGS
jgi:hypothetical protein